MDGSNICQLGTGQEDDWKVLYESAFPLDERTPVDDLRKFMTAGTCLLHRTTNKSNELLCFSVVNLMSNFAFLAYIATDSTKRSTGVGSKHLKQLIDNLKQSHPTHIGLFLEIESTKEQGLDQETQKLRTRRLAFYQRLGAKRMLNKKYHMPACSGTASPRAGELLWIELQANCITEEALPKVIAEIYEKGYGLKSDNPAVKEIVDQWPAPASNTSASPTSGSTASGATCACAEDSPPATTTTPTATTPAVTADVPVATAETPAPTATTPAPAATTPAPAAEMPAPTAETPAATETTPAATETTPAATETVSAATATDVQSASVDSGTVTASSSKEGGEQKPATNNSVPTGTTASNVVLQGPAADATSKPAA